MTWESVQTDGGQRSFLFQRPPLPPTTLSTSLEVGNVIFKHKAAEIPRETPVGTTSLQVYQHLQKMNEKCETANIEDEKGKVDELRTQLKNKRDLRQELDWKRVNVVVKASQEEVDEVMMQTSARGQEHKDAPSQRLRVQGATSVKLPLLASHEA